MEPHVTFIQPDAPFTPEENEIMEHLVAAWNGFVKLPNQTKYATTDFNNGIHELQRILAMRTMRRLFPDYFV